MTDRTAATGGTQPQPVVNEAEIAARALAADKARRDGIAARFAAFGSREGVTALQAACQDDTACTIEAAGEKLLAHLAKHTEPLAGTYVATVASPLGAEQLPLSRAPLQREQRRVTHLINRRAPRRRPREPVELAGHHELPSTCATAVGRSFTSVYASSGTPSTMLASASASTGRTAASGSSSG